MILSDKELGILSSLIKDARKRVRVELIENKKLLFSRSPFESIEDILKELSGESLETVKKEFEIITIDRATALKLKEQFPHASKVKMVGS
eukprot:CAMPEP_0170552856 /NCGR_PEP_ID=MMETSP0211-20121228/10751_1 /TAXON_ID=311385 /ORGANISM="Pseudokeronopsis sp., Strain OXSARD2" /LENGTH=89 /DNA_ID=CAMNT_0010860885 /DNA_START=453 /DNA_END=722 /DNA_ORIENTATION=+